MKRASVIISTRDRGDILYETLGALGRQSFPSEQLEVVVVDDGSRDDTLSRARSVPHPYRMIVERIERQEGYCPARPRNRGLRAATGDVAIFLDADILSGQDLVLGHMEIQEKFPSQSAVIGYTYGYTLDPTHRTPEHLKPPPAARIVDELPQLLAADSDLWADGREATYQDTNDLANHNAPWVLYWGHNASVPRRLALDLGGFDEEFVGWGGEDLEFAYRLHLQGVPFRLSRRASGIHYPHPVPHLAMQRVEQERNRRRIVGKHPGPRLELRLWSAAAFAECWNAVQAALVRPPELSGARRAGVSRLLGWLRKEVLGPGPVLLCGWLPVDLAARLGPAAWCQPYSAFSGAQAGPPNVPLLGLLMPWEDRTFTGAVVAGSAGSLPERIRHGITREIARVAERVVLLDTAAAHASRNARSGSAANDAAAPATALPTGMQWSSVRRFGISVLIAGRGPQRNAASLTGPAHG